MDGEPLGTAVVYANKLRKHVLDINQHDSRNITIVLKTQIGSMAFTGTHAPHAGSKEKREKETQTQEKINYYEQLRKIQEQYGKGANIQCTSRRTHNRTICLYA